MCAHTLLAYTLSLLPPPSTSVLILFFKEDITDIFCESVSIKEPQTRSQNKETTVQNYQEMLNQNTKKSPGIEIALFNCTGETGIDNSGRLNSSLSSFYSYFVTNLRKKNMAYVRLLLNLRPSPIWANTLSAGRPLSPFRSYVLHGWPHIKYLNLLLTF